MSSKKLKQTPQDSGADDTTEVLDSHAAPAVEDLGGSPSRPTLDQLRAAKRVEVAYVAGPPGPVRIAGLVLTSAPGIFDIADVIDQGASHLEALAIDEQIAVRIIE